MPSSEEENIILIKRSNISGVVPRLTSLELGELGLNTHDGKIFLKTETPYSTSIKSFLNSEEIPYVLNESLSSILPLYGNNTVSEVFSVVLGGYNNDITGGGSTVVNGEDNDIHSDFGFIGSGLNNTLSGDYGAILGGKNNQLNHSESFIIGSNLVSHLSGFTYVNNISAQGSFYGDGSHLTGIVATGVVGPDTEVRALTANWESTYLTVSSLSASWASTTADYLPLSGGALTGTITGDLSATGSFYGDGSNLTGIIAGDSEATTLVRSNSANWDSVYTTISSLSANWQTTFSASSAYVSSNPTGITGASALTKLLQITQAGYNAITPASDTLYVIVG